MIDTAQPPFSDDDIAVMKRMAGILGWALLSVVVFGGVLFAIALVESQHWSWRGLISFAFLFAVGTRLLAWSRTKSRHG